MLPVTVTGFTVKAVLVALVRPVLLARSCLPVPAVSTAKPEKLTMPLPAAVPMSSAVIPWSEPLPLLRLRLAVWLLPRPTVELLPKGSWV